MRKPWERLSALIGFELEQRLAEGCVVEPDLVAQMEAAQASGGDAQLRTMFEQLAALTPDAAFPYEEPTDLDAIRASRPSGPRRCALANDIDLFDRIYGAWLGRAAGCALGKPVEKWPKQVIDEYLRHYDALPLDNYIPAGKASPANHPEHFYVSGMDCTRGNITLMPRDDDMDFTILGLSILEDYAADFTSVDVGSAWLNRLPYNLVYTAERVAYRNLINDLLPPSSALTDNPFREWIGAQIRADMWGYVTPGWPEKAAELAFRDASISHTKNGVYGAMFVAALLAASFATSNIKAVIDIALSEVPANCRLAQAVKDTMAWAEANDDWQDTWALVNEKFGHYPDVHTINNAALIVMGLVHGKGDFEQTIVTTVLGGWDADCTGATAGSVIGLILGAKALPEKWVGVFNDQIHSAVRGYEHCRFSDLAQRTCRFADANRP